MGTYPVEFAAAARGITGVRAAQLEPDPGGGEPAVRVWVAPDGDAQEVAAAVRAVVRERVHAAAPEAEAPRPRSRRRAADSSTGAPTAPAASPAPVPDQPAGTAAPPASAPTTQAPRREARPRVTRTEFTSASREFRAAVELAAAAAAVTGRCSGPSTWAGTARAVAGAVVEALTELTGTRVHLEVDHVQLVPLPVHRVVVVRLRLVLPDGVEVLTGTALVRHDQKDAVVRATLDACNRRLGWAAA